MARRTDLIYDFPSNPLATDDSSSGYSIADDWRNSVTGEVFSCADNSIGAAVWISKTRKVIVLQVATSQMVNGVAAVVVDYSTVVSNNIVGASSAAGVVTLPEGEYRASYNLNGVLSDNVRANVLMIAVKGGGGGAAFFNPSISYSYIRNLNNPNGTNVCPSFEGGSMVYTAVGTFTVLAIRSGEGGVYNSVVGQGTLTIEKIK